MFKYYLLFIIYMENYNDIDKTINIQTFEANPHIFDNNLSYINLIHKRFNDRKYFHIIWNLLHLISVNYPVDPTEIQKQTFIEFIKNLKKFSCVSCGKHYTPNENELNNAILSKQNLIQFFIDYHYTINTSIRHFDVRNVYDVNIIIQKYTDNDYKSFFKNIYDIDVEQIITDNNLNLLYDKLPEIRRKINEQKNMDICFTHKIN